MVLNNGKKLKVRDFDFGKQKENKEETEKSQAQLFCAEVWRLSLSALRQGACLTLGDKLLNILYGALWVHKPVFFIFWANLFPPKWKRD